MDLLSATVAKLKTKSCSDKKFIFFLMAIFVVFLLFELSGVNFLYFLTKSFSLAEIYE